jgi:transglutaminase-like putative cysteine protease
MIEVSWRQHWLGVAWVALFCFTLLYGALFAIDMWPLDHVIFPILGAFGSWTATVWVFFTLTLAAIAFLFWVSSGQRKMREEARLGPLSPGRAARRTGVGGTDIFCLVLAVVILFTGRGSLLWFPIASIWTAVLIALLVAVRVEKWPIGFPSREIPDIPSQVIPREGKGIDRVWEWKTLARNDHASVTLWLRESIFTTREVANPSHSGITLPIHGLLDDLIENGSKDIEVQEAARQLLDFARSRRYNYFEEAQNTLQFVQTIPYRTDQETKNKEYFRYAVETLYEDVGDCDCKAILAATLFRLMGLRSVLMLSTVEEHAAVAVEGAPDFPGSNYFDWKGGKYYFCETTDGSYGFTVGEVPPGVDLKQYQERYEVEPQLMGRASAA